MGASRQPSLATRPGGEATRPHAERPRAAIRSATSMPMRGAKCGSVRHRAAGPVPLGGSSRLLTVDELAARLGVAKKVYGCWWQCGLRGYRVSRYLRFRERHVEEWLWTRRYSHNGQHHQAPRLFRLRRRPAPMDRRYRRKEAGRAGSARKPSARAWTRPRISCSRSSPTRRHTSSSISRQERRPFRAEAEMRLEHHLGETPSQRTLRAARGCASMILASPPVTSSRWSATALSSTAFWGRGTTRMRPGGSPARSASSCAPTGVAEQFLAWLAAGQ